MFCYQDKIRGQLGFTVLDTPKLKVCIKENVVKTVKKVGLVKPVLQFVLVTLD